MLASALILGMSACGGNSKASESTTTTAEKKDAEEATGTTATAIESYSIFKNGDMSFSVGDKGYVYNMVDNKLYTYNEDDYKAYGGLEDINGKLGYFSRGAIFNLETGELIACEKENDAKPCYVDGVWSSLKHTNMVVIKSGKAFDGNTYSIGVIDKNGEWVLPMSSEYLFCKDDDIAAYNADGNGSRVETNGKLIRFYSVYDNKDLIYDFKNNKNVSIANSGEMLSDGSVLVFDGTDISKYNPDTGYSEMLCYN